MPPGHGRQRQPGLGRRSVFNSYKQPAVSTQGVVVFPARSRGGMGGDSGGMAGGEPERGIYMRKMAEQGSLSTVFRRGGTVPPQNNRSTGQDGQFASFNEFPSVPRIDAGSDTTATRGQSTPVWTYVLGDGTETRTGRAGVYVGSSRDMPATGASMLGDVYEGGVQTLPHFQVPVRGAVGLGDEGGLAYADLTLTTKGGGGGGKKGGGK